MLIEWDKIIGISFRKREDGYDFIVTTDEAYDAADGWHAGDEEHTIFFKSDCTWQDIRISLDAINYHFQKEVEKQIRAITRKVFDIIGPNFSNEGHRQFHCWWNCLHFEEFVLYLTNYVNYEDALEILNRIYLVKSIMDS